MPRHFSEDEKSEIRKRLVEVGLELFERYGINKTTIGAITDKVGIAKGSFYTFFSSKGDLFMECYAKERENVHQKACEKFKDRDDDLVILIREYAQDLRNALVERPILDIVYDSEAFRLISDKSVRKRLLEFNKLINQQMTDMIQGWMDKNGKYSISARLVTSMMRSINFLRFHDYAIGIDLFDEVVNTLSLAIVNLVKTSKLSN
ncbi:MAG: TetR/AcrR family transcriptional regulator [Christensenellales bacterium]|jgi:AcrR family transcriptional regulator